LDGRDLERLTPFMNQEQLKAHGYEFNEGFKPEDWKPKEFTRENILEVLKRDVAFGFEKALNKRGISSSLMFIVVKMWNWILEEGLENYDYNSFQGYHFYGLPLFKATAVKYGFENQIGDDSGREHKYHG
jgi:hypothetical protein